MYNQGGINVFLACHGEAYDISEGVYMSKQGCKPCQSEKYFTLVAVQTSLKRCMMSGRGISHITRGAWLARVGNITHQKQYKVI